MDKNDLPWRGWSTVFELLGIMFAIGGVFAKNLDFFILGAILSARASLERIERTAAQSALTPKEKE
jgi:hypothetical protein